MNVKLYKKLEAVNFAVILLIISLISCFSVVFWTLSVVSRIKQNDMAKIARDEIVLKKLEHFSNIQNAILDKMSKTSNLDLLTINLPEKLVEVPHLENGFSLLNDPIITLFGVSLIFFTITFIDARRAGIQRAEARDRLNEERNFLVDEIEQLSLQKASFIAAKTRCDAHFNALNDISTRFEAVNRVDLNQSIKNIDDNLQIVSNSLSKIETKEVSTQVDMAFTDFFG